MIANAEFFVVGSDGVTALKLYGYSFVGCGGIGLVSIDGEVAEVRLHVC